MQTGKCVRKHSLFTNCGAKLRLFLQSTKYLLYFCTKYQILLLYFKDFTEK